MSVIRIAFVIDTIDTPAAGTERQLLALLAGLDRREFAPQLVCLHESPWIAEQRFDFPVTFLGVHSLRRPAVPRSLGSGELRRDVRKHRGRAAGGVREPERQPRRPDADRARSPRLHERAALSSRAVSFRSPRE